MSLNPFLIKSLILTDIEEVKNEVVFESQSFFNQVTDSNLGSGWWIPGIFLLSQSFFNQVTYSNPIYKNIRLDAGGFFGCLNILKFFKFLLD